MILMTRPYTNAVLIIDRAGNHRQARIPSNITLMFLTTKSSFENIWLRDNWPRIFKTYDDIVGCVAKPGTGFDQPWKIMSIGRRKWTWVLINARWYKYPKIF